MSYKTWPEAKLTKHMSYRCAMQPSMGAHLTPNSQPHATHASNNTTVEVPFWPPCFDWLFGSCFGSHDEAGLLAFEALQGLPRPARGTHGRSYCGRNRLWGRQRVPECGRAKSGRRDLMGSQRVARPSLEGGMEAASGKKRTPQHEGVTEGRGGNGRKPPPPHTMCHTPHWASAGRVAFYYFVFLKRRKCIRGHFLVVFGIRSAPSQGFSRIRRGIRRHPRVRWQICGSKWLVFRTLPCDVAA